MSLETRCLPSSGAVRTAGALPLGAGRSVLWFVRGVSGGLRDAKGLVSRGFRTGSAAGKGAVTGTGAVVRARDLVGGKPPFFGRRFAGRAAGCAGSVAGLAFWGSFNVLLLIAQPLPFSASRWPHPPSLHRLPAGRDPPEWWQPVSCCDGPSRSVPCRCCRLCVTRRVWGNG